MKKKILALCLVVVLAITAVTGATLAYFTDSDKAENVVTFGNVKIEQWEQERDGSEFVQNQNILPAVLNKLTKSNVTVNGYTFPIRSLEGNYVDKIVSVKNTGTNPAYIRTIVAVPSINGYDDDPDATFNPLHWNYLAASDFEGTGYDWTPSKDDAYVDQTYKNANGEVVSVANKVQDVVIDGVTYDLYIGTYNAAVEAGKITAPAMAGFYLHDTFGYDAEKGNYFFVDGKKVPHDLTEWIKADDNGKVTMKILVASQACQTEGFDDAFEALNTAFGAITKENHPWLPTT